MVAITVDASSATAAKRFLYSLASRIGGQAVSRAGEKTGKTVRGMFKDTTQGWSHSPRFFVRDRGQGSVAVGTDDWLYNLLNAGAESHYIAASLAPQLIYPAFFRPKTAPRTIGPTGGGGKFGPLIFAPVVWHPGFNAREFDLAVKEETERLGIAAENLDREIVSAIKSTIFGG